jgi:alkanesulfonate monooxygenase SsuD/methylene tetrahydromethanopterin reductase-like flavin-dependent oxidoreductase (luciferase family)
VWLVTARNEDTFVEAGKIGANVLTSLILLSVEEVAQRVALYRATLAKHGHDPEQGQVTLMLHTFLVMTSTKFVKRCASHFTITCARTLR